MPILCRFCDNHVVKQPDEPEGPSYMMTLYSENQKMDTLLEKVVNLESRGVLPCVTAWCTRCQSITVIPCVSNFTRRQAHQYYLFLVSWAEIMYPIENKPSFIQTETQKIPHPVHTELQVHGTRMPLSMACQRQRVLYQIQ